MRIPLPEAYLEKLSAQADAMGLDVDAYVIGLLIQQAMFGAMTPPAPGKRPVGRPPTPVDDLPEGVERDPRELTGFAGVKRVGKAWQARIGREAIGRFSSAEIAALARHYAIAGFRVGRSEMLNSLGIPIESARELAKVAGYEPMRSSEQDIAETINRAAGRATPALTRSTMGDGSPEEPGNSEEPEVVPQARSASSSSTMPVVTVECKGCERTMPRPKLGEPPVCDACLDDFQTWMATPALAAPKRPLDGVYETNATGAPKAETFREYMNRTRGTR